MSLIHIYIYIYFFTVLVVYHLFFSIRKGGSVTVLVSTVTELILVPTVETELVKCFSVISVFSQFTRYIECIMFVYSTLYIIFITSQ
jgi:hypothetical protein